MSRVMVAWEFGRNLGHISRLVPLAARLKARGHDVLAVVRELSPAVTLLGPVGVPLMQAPRYTGIPPRDALTVSYADLLLLQGWSDPATLRGMLHGWLSVFRLFQPDVAVLDYAPTARLAARVLGTPCVWVGDGFTLPPLTVPLPPFPGFPWPALSGKPSQLAERSERAALLQINTVLEELRVAPLQALKELFDSDQSLLLTFPELDHYGPRAQGRYIGPLMEPNRGDPADWPPSASRHRILAYLRPEMPDFSLTLEGLAATGASVICYAPGAPQESVRRFGNSRITLASRPVQFSGLLARADACVSYAPAGTVAASLLAGIPQVLAPYHVESTLTADCVERLGAGVVLRNSRNALEVAATISRVMESTGFRLRAREFAETHRDYDWRRVVDDVVSRIEA
jgi:UDP:flavonoid glycosyltransferase YjiC (YdhE family)